MNQVLMPKTTALWLIENTSLTFQQIGDFCALHAFEVQAIADGNTTIRVGLDPITAGQLTRAEIERCQQDPLAQLQMNAVETVAPRKKGPRYTPLAKRSQKPAAVLWSLKVHPELSDTQICKLIGTTKSTIAAIRERRHRDMAQLEAAHPVDIGLCTQQELQDAVDKARQKIEADAPSEPVPSETAESEPASQASD